LVLALSLAGGLAPGCSRSGLDDDDTLVLRPEGTPSPDASESTQDDASRSGKDDASESAEDDASPSSSGGTEGGEFFTTFDAGSNANGAGDGAGCGPANCQGCCAGGVCQAGIVVYACGNGGQPCIDCGPERECTLVGVCG
jgi:hypothetical protein